MFHPAFAANALAQGGISAVPDGQTTAQSIGVPVEAAPFTDDPLVAGLTPVRAVHFRELRERMDALRARAGLSAFAWTDTVLTPGVTPVKRLHLTELRVALAAAYAARGQPLPAYSDAAVTAGTTPIRALHITELRAAVVSLESAANRAPETVGSVPAQTLTAGGTAGAVDVARYFDDPDGDALTYEAVSSDTGIVTVAVWDATVTLMPVAAGAATVGVTARDGGGLSATHAIAVTVRAPDLAMGPPTVTDDSPEPGSTFTLSVTVRNDGAGSAPATTLRYYRSSDPAISTDDTEVGRASVSGLASGASTLASILLTAPSSGGTYYYGACVRPVIGESDAGNNCSPGVQVTVEAAPQPDLVVASPGVSTSTPEPESTFTLSVTVRNDGAGSAPATTLRYYRSSDPAISTDDTEVGRASVSGLASGASTLASILLTAPSSGGTYYYGACVRPVIGESDAGNNCSPGVQVAVEAAPQPDLVVASPGVSTSTPEPESTFTLSVTVRNDGAGSAPATTLRYYRSSDPAISTDDTEVGRASVSGLASGASTLASIVLTAPSSGGTYYYGACVGPVIGESDAGNNCSPGVQVTVEAAPQPDLVVASPGVSTSTPEPESTFTLSVTVRNDGAGSAPATTLRYYRSSDPAISTDDTEVGRASVSGLASGASTLASIVLTAPSSGGTYYYGACVGPVIGESDAGNNCSPGVQVTVEAAPQPDLVVASPGVSTSTPEPESTFTLSVTVRNDGAGSAPATTLRYYRSSDPAISTDDMEVGRASVSELAAGASTSTSIPLTAPSSGGTYYYGACVEAVIGESDAGNNCSAGVGVTVRSPLPDLWIGVVRVSHDPLNPDESFTLSVAVVNTFGNSRGPASPPTTLRYYRSSDSTIDAGDTLVGTDTVPAIAGGGIRRLRIDLRAPSRTGTYYYGACVDAVSGEINTRNNCRGLRVSVELPPDLAVESMTARFSRGFGARASVRATVRNLGGGTPSTTTFAFRRSMDPTITLDDQKFGIRHIFPNGVRADFTREFSDSYLGLPPRGTVYYFGACINPVDKESNTGNNCSAAVRVEF